MTGQPQVFTTRPDGTGLRYLEEIAPVSGLSYGDTMPGGSDNATMLFEFPPDQRHEVINVGRRLYVNKGGGRQWSGSLAEPAPGDGGWTLTADGAGNWGNRFQAVYSSYTASDVLTQAVGRGLPWIVGSVSGGFLGDVKDSASQTVTEFMNAITKPQSQTWRVHQVNSGLQVDLINIPTTVTRLMVCTAPVARTIAGYYNRIFGRYESAADSGSTPATFGLRNIANSTSISLHDVLETFWDLSGSGVLSSGTVDGLLTSALAKYTAASYAGPFTVQPGQYLTTGGVPVDLGCEHAGEVVQLIMMDGPVGAELGGPPVKFPVGKVQYTADSDSLEITPFQAWSGTLTDIMTALTPVAPA